MKKFALKITGLLTAAALVLTGCSDSGSELPDEIDIIIDNNGTSASTEFEETREVIVTAEAAASAKETEAVSETAVSTEAEVTEAVTAAPQNGNSGSNNGNTEAASAKPQNVPQDNSVSGSFSASWGSPNTWEENGAYCGTCELTVTNNTSSAVSGWTAEITVPSGFKITSSWNGKFTVSGTALTVTNESYNGDIAKGGKTSFGFNYSSPSKFTQPDSVTINGTASSGGNNNNNNNNNGGSNNSGGNGGATVTPLPAPAVIGLVKDHGKLSVKGAQLVDKNGNNFQLKGMSTHGLAWFPGFVNENAFKTLRDDWNTNVVRLAMYTAEYGGYCSGGSKAELKALIDKGVQAATKLGMYVIIDWHILNDNNPQTNKAEAKAFFEEMSAKYKNYDNVLYEICNEPNGGTSWDNDIKPYAEEIISVIRKNAPDSVIIVGTPTWSQDIDKAAANPLKEKNVLYALHFYAATHTGWLRDRLTQCCNKGLPVFVSEFGTCDASGNGANDFSQSKEWLSLLDKYGISYINWNLANKNESSSAFKESAPTNGNWSSSDYSEAGAWIRKWFRGEIQ